MINAQLDPPHPERGWTDRGLVLASKPGDNFNAIDPSRLDTADGRAWLAFGSFWDGIKMRELDPASGQLKASNPTLYSLASRGGGAIEAASLLQHGKYFYLFVSFDRCCAGVDSTYRILVGRAGSVTGPYLDREGVPMLQGGGSELQATQGRFVGPGGQEAYRRRRRRAGLPLLRRRPGRHAAAPDLAAALGRPGLAGAGRPAQESQVENKA